MFIIDYIRKTKVVIDSYRYLLEKSICAGFQRKKHWLWKIGSIMKCDEQDLSSEQEMMVLKTP